MDTRVCACHPVPRVGSCPHSTSGILLPEGTMLASASQFPGGGQEASPSLLEEAGLRWDASVSRWRTPSNRIIDDLYDLARIYRLRQSAWGKIATEKHRVIRFLLSSGAANNNPDSYTHKHRQAEVLHALYGNFVLCGASEARECERMGQVFRHYYGLADRSKALDEATTSELEYAANRAVSQIREDQDGLARLGIEPSSVLDAIAEEFRHKLWRSLKLANNSLGLAAFIGAEREGDLVAQSWRIVSALYSAMLPMLVSELRKADGYVYTSSTEAWEYPPEK